MPDREQFSTILLTGATGHTGRRLAQVLLSSGHQLRCLVHTAEHRNRLPESEQLQIVHGSLTQPADVEKMLDGVDCVLHLAHLRLVDNLLNCLTNNKKPVRLIVTSSTRILSQFHTPIVDDLRQAEAAIADCPSHIHWTILRPAMIFGGPEDNNFERLGHIVRRFPLLPLPGGGFNLVQPLFVKDLIAAILSAMEHSESIGQTITLAGPSALPYRDMCRELAQAQNSSALWMPSIPTALLYQGMRFVNALWKKCPIQAEAIRRFQEDRKFDIQPAIDLLDFRPTDFKEALRQKYNNEV